MTGNIETGQYMEQCGYGMPIDIVHALNRQASQENCDGDPYDAMVFAGEYITALRAEITQLRAELAAERELADRTMRVLAESRNWNWIDLEDDRDDGLDVDSILPHLVKLDREISEILTSHATRRNK